MSTTFFLYNVDEDIEIAVNNLENSHQLFFKWLNDNYIKLNTDESHLLVSDESHLLVSRNVGATAKIDAKNVLARVFPYMNMQKRRIFIKPFVTS